MLRGFLVRCLSIISALGIRSSLGLLSKIDSMKLFTIFVRMHGEDFVLNEYSFGSARSTCSGLKDVILSAQVHALISKTRFFSNVYMGLALVDMY
ncbi:hypothetical protein V6N13_132961 [Hibiscus sabdariffa]